MQNDNHGRITVGKYVISPMIQRLDNGSYACAVSICSGRGQGTTDRVLSLEGVFRDSVAACDYAVGEALHWMGISRPLALPA